MYNIIKHEWTDPVSISILNRALYPYVRVTVFADLTESEKFPDDVLSIIPLSLRHNHYNRYKILPMRWYNVFNTFALEHQHWNLIENSQ